MQDILTRLSEMKRPRLLLRAAKAGTVDYVRDQHLRRLLGQGTLPRHGAALVRLMEMENAMDTGRREGATAYSIVEHVDLMIAILGEARLLRAAQSQ